MVVGKILLGESDCGKKSVILNLNPCRKEFRVQRSCNICISVIIMLTVIKQ